MGAFAIWSGCIIWQRVNQSTHSRHKSLFEELFSDAVAELVAPGMMPAAETAAEEPILDPEPLLAIVRVKSHKHFIQMLKKKSEW